MTSEALKRDYIEAYIKQNPGCSLKEVHEHFSGTKQAIYQHLCSLEEHNKVVVEGGGHSASWFPREPYWTTMRRDVYIATKPANLRTILGFTYVNHPVCFADLVHELGVPKATASFGTRRLIDSNLIEKVSGHLYANESLYKIYRSVLNRVGEDSTTYELERIGIPRIPRMESQKANVLRLIEQNPGIPIENVAHALSLAKTTVIAHESALAHEGNITRKRTSRGYLLFPSHWQEAHIETYLQLPEKRKPLFLLERKISEKKRVGRLQTTEPLSSRS